MGFAAGLALAIAICVSMVLLPSLAGDAQQQQKEQQIVAAVAGCRWMCPVWLPVSLEQKG
jgi:hypothetical protein